MGVGSFTYRQVPGLGALTSRQQLVTGFGGVLVRVGPSPMDLRATYPDEERLLVVEWPGLVLKVLGGQWPSRAAGSVRFVLRKTIEPQIQEHLRGGIKEKRNIQNLLPAVEVPK